MRAMIMAVAVAVPGVFMACGSADQPQSTKTLTLELKGDGTNVHLASAPSNPSYAGTYPVKSVDHMTVSILKSGDIEATCTTSVGVAPCIEHPFFTQVQPWGNRTYIKVFDVFGVKVASDVVCVPDGDAGNCDGLDGGDNGGDPPEYPPTPPGGGDDGGGHSCGDGGGGGGGDGGTSDNPPAPPCDPASVAAAQAKFCQDIDAWLQAHGINYQVNCASLNGHFDYSHAKPPVVHVDIPCLEIVEQAWDSVHAELQGCDNTVNSEVINWKSSSRWDLIQHGTCRGSPLVLDLDGDGVNLSSLEQGVAFDLFGSGQKVKTAWIGSGDGWLVLDRNENGVIDGATELFGNVTGGTAHADGFQALGTIDDNGDGVVDESDSAFAKLRVWRDTSRDGRSQPSELVTLEALGIRALIVAATRDEGAASWDRHGNQIPLVGQFVRTDGTRGIVADAYLRFQPLK
jgi:hypothetical protein